MNVNKEQPKEYYDNIFTNRRYKEHFKRSVHYKWWKELDIPVESNVVDLGCGAGQFAEFLKDKGIKKYTGIDFSKVAIKRAKKRVPEYDFYVSNFNSKEWSSFIKRFNPDIYICLETLEHVEKDLELIESLKSKKIIFSVPNFLCKGHVRRFGKIKSIEERYSHVINILNYFSFKRKNNIWHIVHGKIL